VQVTATESINGEVTAVTVAVPNFDVSWIEVAVIVGLPAPAGVKTPDGVIAPPLTPHVYAALKAPVP
jgi:hypothetical protein